MRPVTSDQAEKHNIESLRGARTLTLNVVGHVGNLNGSYFSEADGLSKLQIGCVANWVTREIVGNFFGMCP